MRFFRQLLGREPSRADGGPVEPFGRTAVLRSRGVGILRASAKRRAWWRGIRERFVPMAGEDRRELLVDRVLARFALLVGDLPASQGHHHSGSFGLLDHSMEVAHEVVVGAFSRPAPSDGPDPLASRRERASWVYAGFLAGLLHDVGKVFGMEVGRRDGEGNLVDTPWNPRVGPLVGYLGARGLDRAFPDLVRFIPGRGTATHERTGLLLHPLVVPPGVLEIAGVPFTHVVEAYVERTVCRILPGHLPGAAAHLAMEIRSHDSRTGKEDRKATGTRSRTGAKKADGDTSSGDPGQLTLFPEPSGAAASPPSPPPSVDSDSESAGILDPKVLVASLRKGVVSGSIPRNGARAPVLVRPDRTWILHPEGFKMVWDWLGLEYQADYDGRVLEALSQSGVAVDPVAGVSRVMIRTRPRSLNKVWAVALDTTKLFRPGELHQLGLWPHAVGPVSADTLKQERMKKPKPGPAVAA